MKKIYKKIAKALNILYLTDDAGESGFDLVFIELMQPEKVTA